jgi:hypothetical protein
VVFSREASMTSVGEGMSSAAASATRLATISLQMSSSAVEESIRCSLRNPLGILHLHGKADAASCDKAGHPAGGEGQSGRGTSRRKFYREYQIP